MVHLNIVHPKHGAAHCAPEQLKDMESEGWTVDKDGDGKPDKKAKGKKPDTDEDTDKDGDGK
jgi:hypothetical protein